MLFWKSLCGTVLIVIVSPDFFEKASIMAAIARFGTSSDAEEPKLADLEAEALLPPAGAEVPVQPERSDPPPSAIADPASPPSSRRRLIVAEPRDRTPSSLIMKGPFRCEWSAKDAGHYSVQVRPMDMAVAG
jgi:hypothetical protein